MAAQAWLWPNSEIVRVIDGDSFVAKVHRDMDFGFHVVSHSEAQIKMRLNRINAPELKSPAGQTARLAFLGLIPSGPFLIETVGPYKYGDEWMAEVTLSSGDNLSDEMVRLKHAVYWDGSGPRPHDEG